MFGLKLFLVLLIVSFLTLMGTLVFLKGFLLSGSVMESTSSCDVDFGSRYNPANRDQELEGCWMPRNFKRAVIIIIDALKYDFMDYNTSLNGQKNIPPYKNKLKMSYELERSQPLHSIQFKFIADPPTTTLQRLKGLTTGSLPTFVDAGSNFQSPEIKEDNIIDQMVKQNKNIRFLGDDTWMSLFPNRFQKHYEYPSFDVKDLHTVDNGILAHLYNELKSPDWDITIAHFLGVDHCGHRHGPNHEAMKDKLIQMDNVIRNVTRLMEKDSILFVLGDHGMTRTGDHGGDSRDELEAGLFVYSPSQLLSEAQHKVTSVPQTDFVPTISLLLGLPIPFSSLGMIIPELFSHGPWLESPNEELQLHHRVKTLRLNAQQINQYLQAYQQVSSDLPSGTLRELVSVFREAEKEFKDAVTDLTSRGHSDKFIQHFLRAEALYKQYIQETKTICQGVWAKFDVPLIVTGLVILFAGSCLALFFFTTFRDDEETFPLPALLLIGGAIVLILYIVAHYLLLSDSVPPLMAFVMAVVIVFAAIISMFKACPLTHSIVTADNTFSIILIFMQCCLFFSNSFVVHEDQISLYLLLTMVVFCCIKVSYFHINNMKNNKAQQKFESFRNAKKQKSKFDVVQFLTSPVMVSSLVAASCCVLLRFTHIFRACREEQTLCEDSLFTLPLSSVDKNYMNQRYLFSLFCLAVMVVAVRQWLKYYGNMTGTGITVVTMHYAPPAAAVCMGLYWALQAMPDTALGNLSPWQQALMAQAVYIVVILALLILILWPLLLYNHSTSQVSRPTLTNSSDPATIIPSLYNQLKVQLSPDEQKPPVVYGLGTAYSASVIAMVSLASLVLALLVGDGVAPSLLIATSVLFLCLDLHTAAMAVKDRSAPSHVNSNGNKPLVDTSQEDLGPSWSGVAMLSLLSTVFFYGTGHQATIPNIRVESAYTGFYGNFNYMILPGVLIWLNTFAGPVFFTLSLPLLVLWPSLQGVLVRCMTSQTSNDQQRWQGDFKLFNNGIRLRKNIFQTCCGVLCVACFRLFSAACAAALHRRHLMVWKIFAPRLIYEAAFFLNAAFFSILAYLFILRVDVALAKFVERLPQEKGQKAK